MTSLVVLCSFRWFPATSQQHAILDARFRQRQLGGRQLCCGQSRCLVVQRMPVFKPQWAVPPGRDDEHPGNQLVPLEVQHLVHDDGVDEDEGLLSSLRHGCWSVLVSLTETYPSPIIMKVVGGKPNFYNNFWSARTLAYLAETCRIKTPLVELIPLESSQHADVGRCIGGSSADPRWSGALN